jgi:dynein heavy chain 1
MREVEQVTAEYLPLAQACSAIFFVLEQLSTINHFYQFSLGFFLDIFNFVLHHNPNLKSVTDHLRRREILWNDLFLTVYKRTSRALLHRDHVVLAVLLVQIKLRGTEDISEELEFLMESGDGVATITSSEATSDNQILSSEQAHRLDRFLAYGPFKDVQEHLARNTAVWQSFLLDLAPEKKVPTVWTGISGEFPVLNGDCVPQMVL